MRFDHYSNSAAQLAAELVNAAAAPDWSAERAATLLDERGIGAAGGVDAAALAAVADDLRPVFAAATAQEAVAHANRLLAATAIAPRISSHDGKGPHLHYAPDGAPIADRVRTNSLMGLAILLCDPDTRRLGTCDAHGCEKVFVDVSRNARRRFCSPVCANRAHVAAHRARKRSAGALK